jgi:hypothetical protein
MRYRIYSIQDGDNLWKLLAVAFLVLGASLLTGFWFSYRKAKKYNVKLFNSTSKKLFINMAIPLVTGGIFILILLSTGHFGIAAPACLIFYGISLVQVSANLFDEIRYLGFSEIFLGLISAMLPGYGLIFWAIGFGVLHIVYGAIMHNKYDK